MAFKTFADGVALPASDLNTYLMKQAVIVCTAGTRPASPIEGMTIYETDTDKLLIYTTATTLWQQPWNMPWGRVGGATVTANQTGVTAVQDLTSATTGSLTLVANRRYRATLSCNPYVGAINDGCAIKLLNDATTIGTLYPVAHTASFQTTQTLVCEFTTTSAAHTIKATIEKITGTSANNLASAAVPTTLMLDDVGPSAAPA